MDTRQLASIFLVTILSVRVAPADQSPQPYAEKLTRLPEDQRTLFLFNRPLTLEGEITTKTEFRGDFTLKDDARDDVVQFEQKAELELFYKMTEHLSLFLYGEASYEADLDAQSGQRASTQVLERRESWLYVRDIWDSAASVQIGRQRFREQREWWWDEELDAVRLHYHRPLWHVELAIAQELVPFATDQNGVDPEDNGVLRLLGHTAWRWAEDQQFDTFFLYQHDHSRRHSIGELVRKDWEDERDAKLAWLGARVFGEWDFHEWGEVEYSLQGAWVGGSEVLYDFDKNEDGENSVASRLRRRVSGWSIDTRFTWTLPFPWEPRLTVAYAFGSGDPDTEQGMSQAFQQTGLQDNNGTFRGVNRFRYYGELFRPELSNLHIWTTALGFSLLDKSSIEFVYHFYQQVHPAPFLRDSDLKAQPQGRHRTIGQEWDIVIELEELEPIEIELIGSLFRAGPAFGPLSGELAQGVFFKMEYNF